MKANVRQYTESLLAAQNSGVQTPAALVAGLAQILSRKGKVKILKKVLATLVQKETEEKGIEKITIETAHKADAATRERLQSVAQDMYPGKKIEAQYVENKELQTGFRIRGKDRELDQTFKTRLTKLHKKLI